MTSREIAAQLRISRSAISRRAKKEGWKFTVNRCRGGKTHDFNIADLPDHIRKRINITKIMVANAADWFEWMLDSPWIERVCWAAIGMAVIYFGPVCFRILAR
jgi:hypothetical protein